METTIKIINPKSKYFGQEINGRQAGRDSYVGFANGRQIIFDKIEIDHYHFQNQLLEIYIKESGYEINQKVKLKSAGSCYGNSKQMMEEYQQTAVFTIKDIDYNLNVLLENKDGVLTCYNPDLTILS